LIERRLIDLRAQKKPSRGSDDENQKHDFKVNGALTMLGDDIEIVLDVEMVRLYRQSAG
jgi:hypothetical protein